MNSKYQCSDGTYLVSKVDLNSQEILDILKNWHSLQNAVSSWIIGVGFFESVAVQKISEIDLVYEGYTENRGKKR